MKNSRGRWSSRVVMLAAGFCLLWPQVLGAPPVSRVREMAPDPADIRMIREKTDPVGTSAVSPSRPPEASRLVPPATAPQVRPGSPKQRKLDVSPKPLRSCGMARHVLPV